MDNSEQQKKIKYELPTNAEGVELWVPVVIKNRDALIGYIDGTINALSQMSILHDDGDGEEETDDCLDDVDLCLDSARFNDLIDDGKRLSKMTEDEFEQTIADKENKSVNEDVLQEDDYYFSVHCPNCGMFYGFRGPQEIPTKSCKCSLCGRLLIDYTGHEDDEYEYDSPTESDQEDR